MELTKQKSSSIVSENSILLGFALRQKITDGSLRLKFRWARLASACAALIATAWLCTAGVLYLHFKYQKDFDAVSYASMITLPFQLNSHRIKLGNHHVERGMLALSEKEYGDAFRLLRLGLARAPANIKARLIVAEYYEFALRRPQIAVELMLAGLDKGGLNDINFLKRTLALLLRHKMDDKVLEIANRFLPAQPDLTPSNQVIAFAAASSYYWRGYYDSAEDYLNDYQLLKQGDGKLLSAQISWGRGNKLSAIEKIEFMLRRAPKQDALWLQLIKYYRAVGNLEQARRSALLFNIENLSSHQPKIELLYIFDQSGENQSVSRQVESILEFFSDNSAALAALAKFAADTGRVKLASRVYERALENEFDLRALAPRLIEAYLNNGDFLEGLKLTETLTSQQTEWSNSAELIGLRSILSYQLNQPELGDLHLKNYLTEHSYDGTGSVDMANRFLRANQPQKAQQILKAAYDHNPSNQNVLARLLKVTLASGNSENLLELTSKFIKVRRPEAGLLLSAYHRMASDRLMFSPGRDELLLQLRAILRQSGKDDLLGVVF
jgi:uncharacterized protein HemY